MSRDEDVQNHPEFALALAELRDVRDVPLIADLLCRIIRRSQTRRRNEPHGEPHPRTSRMQEAKKLFDASKSLTIALEKMEAVHPIAHQAIAERALKIPNLGLFVASVRSVARELETMAQSITTAAKSYPKKPITAKGLLIREALDFFKVYGRHPRGSYTRFVRAVAKLANIEGIKDRKDRTITDEWNKLNAWLDEVALPTTPPWMARRPGGWGPGRVPGYDNPRPRRSRLAPRGRKAKHSKHGVVSTRAK
jgi:hypothetical protein